MKPRTRETLNIAPCVNRWNPLIGMLSFLMHYENIFVTRDVYLHDVDIKWKHFLRYWSFVRGIHRSPVDSPHKGRWRGALMFTLMNKRLSKQSRRRWFQTPSHSLWRHSNEMPLLPSIISQHRDGSRNPPSWNIRTRSLLIHYNDVIMGTIASQIASLTIVYSTVYSNADRRKHSKRRVTGLWSPEFTGDRWIPPTNGQ